MEPETELEKVARERAEAWWAYSNEWDDHRPADTSVPLEGRLKELSQASNRADERMMEVCLRLYPNPNRRPVKVVEEPTYTKPTDYPF